MKSPAAHSTQAVETVSKAHPDVISAQSEGHNSRGSGAAEWVQYILYENKVDYHTLFQQQYSVKINLSFDWDKLARI